MSPHPDLPLLALQALSDGRQPAMILGLGLVPRMGQTRQGEMKLGD